MTEKSNLIKRIGKGINIGIAVIVLTGAVATGKCLSKKITPEYKKDSRLYEIEIPATRRIDHILNPNLKVAAEYRVYVPTCKGDNIPAILSKYEKKFNALVYFAPNVWEDEKTDEIYVQDLEQGIRTSDLILIDPFSKEDVLKFIENVENFSEDVLKIHEYSKPSRLPRKVVYMRTRKSLLNEDGEQENKK